MSTLSNRDVRKELQSAVDKYVAANAVYISLIKLHAISELSTTGQTTKPPKTFLDINDLREFEEAWVRVEEASKLLRRNFMKLYNISRK
jgi:hypothetical protein